LSKFGEFCTAEVDRYRSYLLLLARMNLNGEPQRKIEPSDVVQQTLLEAHAARERLPADEEELCAWLRTALANNIRDQRKHLRRQKRDPAREKSLEAALAESSQRLADQAATLQPSPSQQAMRAENLLRLAAALWKLPEAQRDTIILHHLQGWTISQTAERLGKTDAAIAGLLHRGLRELREILGSRE
jgi:RNA polymerase sigma-70 factor, ECF subfamily